MRFPPKPSWVATGFRPGRISGLYDPVCTKTSRWQQTLASMNKGGRQCSRADCDTVLVPGASKVRVARATVLRAGAAGLGALPGRDRLPTSAFDHCHGTMVKVASDVGDV